MTEESDIPPQATTEEGIDYKDKYLRLLAEGENTRRRLQKEKQDMMKFCVDNVFSDILAPIDQLENALQFASEASPEVKGWAMGFQMILTQFKEILESRGIKPFVSEGELFDAELHEAVEAEETDAAAPGTILKVFVKGYKSGDRVIRPARVKVAKEVKKENQHVPTEEK